MPLTEQPLFSQFINHFIDGVITGKNQKINLTRLGLSFVPQPSLPIFDRCSILNLSFCLFDI